MNKKLILVMILSAFILAACKNKPVEADENKNSEVNNPIENSIGVEKNDDTNKETQVEADNNEEDAGEQEEENLVTHEDNPLLIEAVAGKLDTVEYAIGSSTEEIAAGWGIDNNYDYFMGGLYFIYEERGVVFFTSAYDVDNEIQHGEVVAIGVFGEETTAFGIKIGMTFEEIKAILGEPTYLLTPDDTEGDELFYGSWIIMYQVGEYRLSFSAEEEIGPINGTYIR